MAPDAPDDDADPDPGGHLAAMLDAAIAHREHGGDPDLAHKIAALADEGGDEAAADTDVWDDPEAEESGVVGKAVMDARQPYHGAYPGDKCPECGEKPRSACRCRLNDRRCENGHTWRRDKDTGMPLLLEGGHGPVIKTYGEASQ